MVGRQGPALGSGVTCGERPLAPRGAGVHAALRWASVVLGRGYYPGNSRYCFIGAAISGLAQRLTTATELRTSLSVRVGVWRSIILVVEPGEEGSKTPVSYTHLTLPTNREV